MSVYIDQLPDIPRRPWNVGANNEPSPVTNAQYEAMIKEGSNLHNGIVPLSDRGYSEKQLRDLMMKSAARYDPERQRRWQECLDKDIPRAVASAKKRCEEQLVKAFGKGSFFGHKDTPNGSQVDVPIISASSFHGKTAPRQAWLYEDLIPAGQVCLLSGDGGLGKSLLALHMSVATVIGLLWLSRAGLQGPALYISCEDEAAELHRRLVKIAKHYGRELRDLEKLHLATMAELDALLAAPIQGQLNMTPLWEALVERVNAIRPSLIILDSLADIYGGSEIDRAQVRWFIAQLRALCHKSGTTIVILSHPSLSGLASGSGLSGSTHWNNAVRSRLYLTRPKDGEKDERILEVLKNNRGETGQRIELQWFDGVFIARDGGSARQFVEADIDASFIAVLRRYSEQSLYVNATGGATYAPNCFVDEPEFRGNKVAKKQLRESMKRLIAEGKIENRQRKVDGKIRRHLAIMGEA